MVKRKRRKKFGREQVSTVEMLGGEETQEDENFAKPRDETEPEPTNDETEPDGYRCDACGKVLPSRAGLSRHRSRMHGIKPTARVPSKPVEKVKTEPKRKPSVEVKREMQGELTVDDLTYTTNVPSATATVRRVPKWARSDESIPVSVPVPPNHGDCVCPGCGRTLAWVLVRQNLDLASGANDPPTRRRKRSRKVKTA